MRRFLDRYGHVIINVFLLVCLGRYAMDRSSDAFCDAFYHQKYRYAELAFALHNIVMLFFIMVRRRHQSIEKGLFNQGIALVAFFSGMAFVQVRTDHILLLKAGEIVIVVAMILSTITVVNLGRSFGILISLRKVKTNGLYGVVRHPMYLTDILWRIGIVLTWPSLINGLVFFASSAAYVYRAVLEERFLCSQDEYRTYMERVRYRFIPGLF